MKIDKVDLLLFVMGTILVGVIMGVVSLFQHYCEVLGTSLTAMVGLGFLTLLVLIGYVDHLIRKYHK